MGLPLHQRGSKSLASKKWSSRNKTSNENRFFYRFFSRILMLVVSRQMEIQPSSTQLNCISRLINPEFSYDALVFEKLSFFHNLTAAFFRVSWLISWSLNRGCTKFCQGGQNEYLLQNDTTLLENLNSNWFQRVSKEAWKWGAYRSPLCTPLEVKDFLIESKCIYI